MICGRSFPNFYSEICDSEICGTSISNAFKPPQRISLNTPNTLPKMTQLSTMIGSIVSFSG